VKNAMSSDFVHEIKSEMDQAPFMQYNAMHKPERRIRIVSEEKSEFLVGKGIDTKRYASAQTMLSCERKIIWSMNAFVAMYASLFEKALGIKVRLADQLQEVKDLLKDGGYAAHNDQAGLCCLIGDEEPMSPENEFDGPEFMVVATYVLSNEQCQNTVVTWKKNEDQKVTRSLRTASNEIHFQAINCQALAKHEVKAIADKANRFGPTTAIDLFSLDAPLCISNRTRRCGCSVYVSIVLGQKVQLKKRNYSHCGMSTSI
jgi:hypothetical protein